MTSISRTPARFSRDVTVLSPTVVGIVSKQRLNRVAGTNAAGVTGNCAPAAFASSSAKLSTPTVADIGNRLGKTFSVLSQYL